MFMIGLSDPMKRGRDPKVVHVMIEGIQQVNLHGSFTLKRVVFDRYGLRLFGCQNAEIGLNCSDKSCNAGVQLFARNPVVVIAIQVRPVMKVEETDRELHTDSRPFDPESGVTGGK